MDYIELTLNLTPKTPWTEILIGELADMGFESFTEENDKFQAYISSKDYNKDKTQSFLKSFGQKDLTLNFEEKLIPSQNWNLNWESDFEPVEIGKRLLIRAPFHAQGIDFEETIEIQPQMSFGTGHHQTTYLLSKVLLDLDLKDKTILDVGTGTGILGILASKKGAKSIIGTDIETGACENAIENIARNNILNFSILEGDLQVVPNEKYDVIIANINKNVLKKHLAGYADRSKKGTILLLSGFFETDVPELIGFAEKFDFIHKETHLNESWAVIQFKM
ncbi:MAG: 50S ribosomal protein L11 methyltransferase [Fluviicola sp.]|nr:MAG: 50S ribosomal protein L11 methyltransferase [Fluviicola sp.]